MFREDAADNCLPERPIISRKTKKIKFTIVGIQKAGRGYDLNIQDYKGNMKRNLHCP